MSEVTRILTAIEQGDPAASDQLLPLVYDELRKLAAIRLDNERPGQTLQATALVHEAYLRLIGVSNAQQWEGRGHFFAAAAEAMRRILVEQARRKSAQKRGGEMVRVPLDETAAVDAQPSDTQLFLLDQALGKLESIEPIKAQLVKLRYFAGLTGAQAADALQIGVWTADKYWAHAKVWLKSEMNRLQNDASSD